MRRFVHYKAVGVDGKVKTIYIFNGQELDEI